MDERGDRDEIARPPLLRTAAIFYALMFAAALVWGAVEGRVPVFASAESAARGVRWGVDPGIGLAVGLLIVGLSDVVTRATRWGDRTARMLAEVIGPVRTGNAVALALLSSVAEELLFRGALQPHLGLVGTSLLFGLAHLAPRRALLPWTGMAVVAGFLLGGLFLATGNLAAPVVAHFVVNAVNLRALSRRYLESPGA